jgi:hypothetical protein
LPTNATAAKEPSSMTGLLSMTLNIFINAINESRLYDFVRGTTLPDIDSLNSVLVEYCR